MLKEYDHLLKKIDNKIAKANQREIPGLFQDIPLAVFGELSLQEQDRYRNIKNFFPRMASADIQNKWTGTNGRPLLAQSIAAMKTIMDIYRTRKGADDLSDINVLDFGCGWGRLIRLLYKYVPVSNIYAVDAWDLSLETCREYGVKAHFAKIDEICTGIPFDVKFDLVYAFSVFTHLSKRSSEAALKAIRHSIKDGGMLMVTIRGYNFWEMYANYQSSISVQQMVADHMQHGFAFTPHNRTTTDGEVTYGDTSISLEYIRNHWTDWKVIDCVVNAADPYQTLVFLQPV